MSIKHLPSNQSGSRRPYTAITLAFAVTVILFSISCAPVQSGSKPSVSSGGPTSNASGGKGSGSTGAGGGTNGGRSSGGGGNGGSGGSGSGGSGSGGPIANAIPANFFGMHMDWQNTPWPNVAFGTRRLWDSNTGWSQINTANGVYDWTVMDSLVNATLANNADVLYDFGRTPGWAQCAAKSTRCVAPIASVTCTYDTPQQGGAGQCYPPKDLNVDGTGQNQYWINWVTAVASRYKGQIKYYEIWNEPSAPTMWQGTDAQLVRLAQDARCIIIGTGCNSQSVYTQIGIDPAAQITTPAFVSDDYQTLKDAMTNYLQAGGGQYADIIAYHGYVQWPGAPERAATDLSNLRKVLTNANVSDKPVWSTEGGYGVYHTISDPDQQAAWIARYLIVQQSAGLARTYWYAWDASDAPFWTKTGGTTNAGSTYGEVINWLVGAALTSPCVATGTVWQCGYTRGNGYDALAVWDTAQSCSRGTCTTSTFNVPFGYTYVRDLNGTKVAVAGSAVQIGIKPILLETQ